MSDEPDSPAKGANDEEGGLVVGVLDDIYIPVDERSIVKEANAQIREGYIIAFKCFGDEDMTRGIVSEITSEGFEVSNNSSKYKVLYCELKHFIVERIFQKPSKPLTEYDLPSRLAG